MNLFAGSGLQPRRDDSGGVADAHRAADFTRLLRQWAGEHRYGNATIEQFQARAEQISGKRLGHFFDAWLRTPGKPADW